MVGRGGQECDHQVCGFKIHELQRRRGPVGAIYRQPQPCACDEHELWSLRSVARVFGEQFSCQPVAASGSARHHCISLFGRQRSGGMRFRFGLERHVWARGERPLLHALQRLRRRHPVQRLQCFALLVLVKRFGHTGFGGELHSGSGVERKRTRRRTAVQWRRPGAGVRPTVLANGPGPTGCPAMAGYDQGTGLGSVAASALVGHGTDARIVPAFQAALSANSLSVTAGSNSSISMKVTVSGGFSAAVSLSITGLPAGVSAAFTPASISAPGSGSSVLKLTATSSAKPGLYSVTVVASSGSTKHTVSLPVAVAPLPRFTLASSVTSLSVAAGASTTLTLTSTPNSTFSAAITLTVTGLPTGVTAQFLPASIIAAPGAGVTTVTFSAASSVTVKSYLIVVAASGGGLTQKQTLTMNVPGLTLTPSVSSVTVSATTKGTVKFTAVALGGFSSSVTFSVSGLPTGISGSFSPASLAAPGNGTSKLTLTKGSGAVTGSSHFTVAATGSSFSRSLTEGRAAK